MTHFSATLWLVDLRVGEELRFCECDETHGVVGTGRRGGREDQFWVKPEVAPPIKRLRCRAGSLALVEKGSHCLRHFFGLFHEKLMAGTSDAVVLRISEV